MSGRYSYFDDIDLYVKGRIPEEDAQRQTETAREILRRLERQPGLILADEVGMGKTFVALAVAASVALADTRRRPIVVMVPPSLKEKWPRDFEVFRERCLPPDVAEHFRYARAEKAVDFLKLLDDPLERRKSVIFLTHGAMSRALRNGWVKLALIYRALYGRHDTGRLRTALCRSMGKLLWMGWLDRRSPQVWEKLLSTDPELWLSVLHRHGIDPEHDDDPDTDDDPVPEVIREALHDMDVRDFYRTIKKEIPYARSKYYERNLTNARQAIKDEMKELWADCIKRLRFKLPLLILDEAHHLKNARTRLASLFQVPDAQDDAEEISKGPLGGVFERMLFLTATPFQLGHYELCSVLDRFHSIAWRGGNEPSVSRERFTALIGDLRRTLDSAQEAAVRLDTAWGLLRREDLMAGGRCFADVAIWWEAARSSDSLTAAGRDVVTRFEQAVRKMREAEEALRPWVIRHLRHKKLPHPFREIQRRCRLVGNSIVCAEGEVSAVDEQPGIEVGGSALLPFLLAARATAFNPESRPVFAEGLASSYEAFMYTRHILEGAGEEDSTLSLTDEDDDSLYVGRMLNLDTWYLDRLEEALALGRAEGLDTHPKLVATVQRAIDLWRGGEKVLIFCHYIATGRALRQYISREMWSTIRGIGDEKLPCPRENVIDELDKIGTRFFDVDSPLRTACDVEVEGIVRSFPDLSAHREKLIEIVRRYVRTPTFLARYFPLEDSKLTGGSVEKAFNNRDASGFTLRRMLEDFFVFLVERCGESERMWYIDALEGIQTGSLAGADVSRTFGEDEIQGDRSERLVPNVRLVNGDTRQASRQKLMLTFNTPFYPEILIASSVMAEGVDLQLNCRHVIHHDLCWNPSTLEQRTGRIDRIGAKVERCGRPIIVYIPYIAETQDEKMYRVVMDRERWFKVVMGENYKVDARTTDKLADRLPLPMALAEELAFRLNIFHT